MPHQILFLIIRWTQQQISDVRRKHQWAQNKAIEIVQSVLQSKKRKKESKQEKRTESQRPMDNIKHIIGTPKERKDWMNLKNICRNNGQKLKFYEKQIYIDSRSTNNPK